MTFPILASLLVRLVVLLPFQLLRLSLATASRWTPLALSVFLHCVVAVGLSLLWRLWRFMALSGALLANSGLRSRRRVSVPRRSRLSTPLPSLVIRLLLGPVPP